MQMSVHEQEQSEKNRLGTRTEKETCSEGWFECNICLDTAHEPVVTQCGHLYCWACIYQWAHHHKTNCPVCKTCISIHHLVPLYCRGPPSSTRNNNCSVPRLRPPPTAPAPPSLLPRAGDDAGYSCVSGMEMVYARVFGMSLMTSPYEVYGVGHSRHDILTTISLHRLSLFLLCCLLLCLLF